MFDLELNSQEGRSSLQAFDPKSSLVPDHRPEATPDITAAQGVAPAEPLEVETEEALAVVVQRERPEEVPVRGARAQEAGA